MDNENNKQQGGFHVHVYSPGNYIIDSITYNAPVYYGQSSYSKDEDQEETKQEPVKPAKQEIIDYVGRLKPVIAENVIGRYEEIWLRILNLEEVRSEVYNKGRQQGTNFNRNLVANIIHLMAQKGMVTSGTNDVQLSELLEPEKGKNHPVRNSLGLSPESKLKKAIEGLFEELDVEVRES